MKSQRFSALLSSLIVILSLMACNDKLHIAAPYKDITVVYSLLDRGDTAHYIRIQKAYMDDNKSSIDMAKEADSNFYRSLKVVIKEVNSSGRVLSIIDLQKVNLLTEGYTKDTGAFFNSPAYAYKFKHILDTNYSYRLVITNTETGKIDSAETPILTNMGPNIGSFSVIEWQRNEINFTKTYRENGEEEESSYTLILPPNAGAYELIMRFSWVDSNKLTHSAVHKTADYSDFNQKVKIFNPSTTSTSRFDVFTPNKNIYQYLYSVIGPTNDINQVRILDSIDMYLYIAGIEYHKYKDLNTNKGGVTADEIRPYYTNLKGGNCIGLFSTKSNIKKIRIPIGLNTRDSLKANPITRGLNLQF